MDLHASAQKSGVQEDISEFVCCETQLQDHHEVCHRHFNLIWNIVLTCGGGGGGGKSKEGARRGREIMKRLVSDVGLVEN